MSKPSLGFGMFKNLQPEKDRIKIKKSNSTKSQDHLNLQIEGYMPMLISEVNYFPRNRVSHDEIKNPETEYYNKNQ